MGGGGGSACSSSGEEDGDAEWKKAINSVATSASNGPTIPKSNSNSTEINDTSSKSVPKLYQIKLQKLLDDYEDKRLEFVREPIPPDNSPEPKESGIRLFKKAPRGKIILDPADHSYLPLKRPRIVPGDEIDEKSKKFKKQVRSVAVDGADIIRKAKDACHKAMARLEAKEAKAKERAKEEEERIKELKKIRGEKWLPAVAREMQMHQTK